MIGSGPSSRGSRWKRAFAAAASVRWTISPSTLIPCRVSPAKDSRERLPRHPELRGDEALLQRKPDRFARQHLRNQANQVTANTLLRRPELQVLRMLYLAPKLGGLAGKDRKAEIVIRSDRLAKRLCLDHDEAGFIQNARPKQIRLAVKHGRR